MTNEPSPRPWHHEGKCIFTADGDFIGEMEHTDDASLVVAAVNKHGMPIVELIKAYDALEAERDRLRDELTRKAQNYEDVIAYHRRTEESLRDLVRRLLAIAEPAVSELKEFDAAILSVGGARVLPVAEKESVIREARAALGEGETPTGKGAER